MFNWKQLLSLVVPFLPLGAEKVLSFTERALQISKKDLEKLTSGMSAEDKAEARELSIRLADAASDFLVFVASRGEIEAD